MGKEIERKYTVDKTLLPDLSCIHKSEIEQYYFNDSDLADILKETYDSLKGHKDLIEKKEINDKYSARIRKKDEQYFFTLKGPGTFERDEWEIDIPKETFDKLLQKTKYSVKKTRYYIELENDMTAELDIYEGRLKGLMIAEVEFDNIDACRSFIRPGWFAEEVTELDRYRNESLAKNGL